MRSELRDRVAGLLMEAIQHRERASLLFWLCAYCQVTEGHHPPAVPFIRLAQFVRERQGEVRWCGGLGQSGGRKLISDSGLFRLDERETVAIAPQYQKAFPDICKKAAAYWKVLKILHRRRYGKELLGVLQRAAVLWEARLFFEFHEILEDVWMKWRGPERRFLQGLIQLGVAFYHIQRNNYRGAMSMFRNGFAKVMPHSPRYCGVELKKFLKRIEKCRSLVEGLGPGYTHRFDWSLVPALEVTR